MQLDNVPPVSWARPANSSCELSVNAAARCRGPTRRPSRHLQGQLARRASVRPGTGVAPVTTCKARSKACEARIDAELDELARDGAVDGSPPARTVRERALRRRLCRMLGADLTASRPSVSRRRSRSLRRLAPICRAFRPPGTSARGCVAGDTHQRREAAGWATDETDQPGRPGAAHGGEHGAQQQDRHRRGTPSTLAAHGPRTCGQSHRPSTGPADLRPADPRRGMSSGASPRWRRNGVTAKSSTFGVIGTSIWPWCRPNRPPETGNPYRRLWCVPCKFPPRRCRRATRREQNEAACVRRIVYKVFVSGKEAARQWCVSPGCKFGPDRNRRALVARRSPRPRMGDKLSPRSRPSCPRKVAFDGCCSMGACVGRQRRAGTGGFDPPLHRMPGSCGAGS